MMTEDDILEIGFMLEEKGLSHAQIDEYLEHHGVKGMRWGVRRRGRIARTGNVGAGGGSTIDKLRVYSMTNPGTLIKKRGSFKKAAQHKGKRMAERNQAIASGKAKVFKDILPTIGAWRYSDVVPGVGRKKLTADNKTHLKKMDSGKEVALSSLAIIGTLGVANQILRRRAY